MERSKEIDKMREVMGTLPSMQPKKKTEFIRGCSRIKVELIGYPLNPYKQIFEAATATWGDDDYEYKWPKVSVENRIKVVRASLEGKTLPQALESITFQFRVNGVSRSAFDQAARARVGATFFSSGVRDNNKLDASFIMPTELYDNRELRKDIEEYVKMGKDLYEKIISKGQGSWQSARCILPMGMNHPFEFSMTYLALMGQCSRRLKFCEQEDTVGLFWSVREALKDKFPLLAIYLRPSCDRTKRCQYHESYSLSEMFGCLFKSCGRNSDNSPYVYATFNRACTVKDVLEEQLGFKIPNSNEDLPENYEIDVKDYEYFAAL
ncbi:FAD-dependent thymidylate synthase [Thermosipho sp. (in: thermotogales)]|jgi:thymidylate synthase ThyX|uniref:FAD-dependent thymidylate synthase n=1 Tax=Thermosipho sp. (in: thermotogales) TaxID=1968895 RepID=UPI00257D0D2A|nr:FAD-dependent thymidylate synthase [Thermosipho sp. (in: thermotogales)]MBZ4649275.1 hypothetical protein [Thermosipho sp. (in: thermotogales)]